MWNSIPSYLIWNSKCSYSVCTVRATSLQTRPDFSKFSFKPCQVNEGTKLNWNKRQPRTIHKPSLPTPELLSLVISLQNHHLWFLHKECFKKRETHATIACFKYRRCYFFHKCAKKRARVRCSQQKHACQPLSNMAHSSSWLGGSWDSPHVGRWHVGGCVSGGGWGDKSKLTKLGMNLKQDVAWHQYALNAK